jgi:hypothetical protein
MTKIKLYYFKNAKRIPYDDMHNIMVLGEPKKEYIDKYYECVYEKNEKKVVTNIDKYLMKIIQKFTFKGNPLRSGEKKDHQIKIRSHVNISVGDVIMIGDKHYAVKYEECEEIIN